MADSSSNDVWRSDSFVTRLDNARKGARFTDITFVMGEGNSKRAFPVHKAILACGSPVFEKMFYGALAETRNTIETDDDPEAFEMLLNYFYGKSNIITSLTSAWKLFTIGDKYLVPTAQDTAKEYIKSTALNEESFWNIIETNVFSSPLFLEKVNSYMTENTNKLIQSKKFLNVTEIIIDNLLQMDKLNIEEYQLLLAVTKWANQNKNQKTIKFYKYIRFSTLTMDEFFQFLDSYPTAIDAQSSLEILRHLHNPSRHNLPKWCSASKARRFKEFQQSGYVFILDLAN